MHDDQDYDERFCFPPRRGGKPVMCVRHRDGWCELIDQHNTAYRDMMETKCGHIVSLPWGIEKRKPTCLDCISTKL